MTIELRHGCETYQPCLHLTGCLCSQCGHYTTFYHFIVTKTFQWTFLSRFNGEKFEEGLSTIFLASHNVEKHQGRPIRYEKETNLPCSSFPIFMFSCSNTLHILLDWDTASEHLSSLSTIYLSSKIRCSANPHRLTQIHIIKFVKYEARNKSYGNVLLLTATKSEISCYSVEVVILLPRIHVP